MVFLIFICSFVKKLMNVHGRKLTNESQGKLNRYLMRLLEQFLELVMVFKEASETFILIYVKTRQAKRTDFIL